MVWYQKYTVWREGEMCECMRQRKMLIYFHGCNPVHFELHRPYSIWRRYCIVGYYFCRDLFGESISIYAGSLVLIWIHTQVGVDISHSQCIFCSFFTPNKRKKANFSHFMCMCIMCASVVCGVTMCAFYDGGAQIFDKLFFLVRTHFHKAE